MKQRAMAIVIAGVMLAAGLSVAPAATAGHTDCHKDFDIADSELLANDRTLDPGDAEIGLEDASDGVDEKVKVVLKTNDQKLNVTIREDNGSCQPSSNVSPQACQSTFVLDTTGTNTEDSMTCTIEAPDSGTRDFYFDFVHPDTGGSSLDYQVFVTS